VNRLPPIFAGGSLRRLVRRLAAQDMHDLMTPERIGQMFSIAAHTEIDEHRDATFVRWIAC
jgi:hypothetical protein